LLDVTGRAVVSGARFKRTFKNLPKAEALALRQSHPLQQMLETRQKADDGGQLPGGTSAASQGIKG